MAITAAEQRTGRTEIRGHTAPGFEPVREAFAANFEDGREIGAACAVHHRGELVVDLWAGLRDHHTGDPWERDTLVGVFSAGKGIAAMAIALLHSRGLLDFDAPVAAYWSEFAQHGKDRITVRQLLAHQAGMCALDQPVDAAIIGDLDRLGAILARQRPAWEPGRRHGYHAVTIGWYQGELLRRIDPRHRTLGQFVHDELVGPLGIEFYIGAPRDLPESRFACIKDFRPTELLYRPNGIPLPMFASLFIPWSLTVRAFFNPRVKRPADLVNPPLRYVEIPSGNAVATSRSIARLYGAFAGGGAEFNLDPRTIDQLEAPAHAPAEGERDLVLKTNVRYALGFAKPMPTFTFGTSDRAYGGAGLGGSMGLADPDTRTGYAYTTNRHGAFLWDDPRERRIREAMYRSIAARR
jgi:CubicO group peptidase (beta-lactamase class C family)